MPGNDKDGFCVDTTVSIIKDHEITDFIITNDTTDAIAWIFGLKMLQS